MINFYVNKQCFVIALRGTAARCTALPVSQIAKMVGYESQSYFNLQFTRHVGMPPKRFRENYVVPDHTAVRKRRRASSG